MATDSLQITKGAAGSVLILGAGVVGMASAYALARRGYAVTIVDQESGVGQGASFANGAQLSYAYTDALATPKLLRHLPALALGLDPVFRLKPRVDPGYIAWLLRFVRNCTASRAVAATLAGLELGLESRLAMHALLAHHPLDFGHAAPGKLHIFKDPAGFAGACQMASIKVQHGATQHVLTAQEAIALEPALAAYPDGFIGALYAPEDELGDPHLFCNALQDVLVRNYGVTLRTGVQIRDIRPGMGHVALVAEDGQDLVADHLLVCAGLGAQALLARFGLGSALLPMKGYSMTLPAGPKFPQISITDVSRKLVFCPLNGTMRIAGLAELGSADGALKPDRLAVLQNSALAALPEAADYAAPGHLWAGARPMTANSLPIIQTVAPGITVNIGHGMLGWTYAMGAAERAAHCLMASGR